MYLFLNLNNIMPNEDGTGPRGGGPLTGRRLGRCLGDQQIFGFWKRFFDRNRGKHDNKRIKRKRKIF